MTLRLNGSTSGYTEIDAPAVAGSNTIVLPSGNGSANQLLKNGSTAGTLGWSSMVETPTGVGIGTSTPAYLLDVKTHEVALNANGSVRFGPNDQYSVRLKSGADSGGTPYASIIGPKDGGNGYLTFHTGVGETERMRIRNNGRTLFNCTSEFASGVVQIDAASGNDGMCITASTTGDRSPITFHNPNGLVGRISTNGTSTGYITSSDYRLKENVIPLTGAADRVNQLKPSQFNFIVDPDRTVDGFIAHEVQTVVPECIFGEKDAVNEDGSIKPQGIDQSKLVPLLTAALQEALAKIDALETRIAALEVTP